MNAAQIVEAVLFASDAPLTADEIARADEQLDEDIVEQALQALQAEYDDAQRAFQLVELAEGFQLLTRPEYAPYLERFDNVPRSSRLSGPALETLAIIAYRQPIGRLEIEYIRGVNVAGVVRTLQERELIEVVGREEGLGRPLLYGTTKHFLEHFGFRSKEDLPRPEELPIILRERVPLDAGGQDEGENEGRGAAGDDASDQPSAQTEPAPEAPDGEAIEAESDEHDGADHVDGASATIATDDETDAPDSDPAADAPDAPVAVDAAPADERAP